MICTLLFWIAAGDTFLPDWPVDPDVPTIESVLGFDFAEKVSYMHEAVRFVETLDAHSDRIKVEQHGTTWEGRPMVLVFISSPQNLGRLGNIQAGYQKLADPRITSAEERDQLARDLPVCVWLNESVHGDEISGTDSALVLSYHLAAATDPKVSQLLEDVLIVIELCQNPDGRARFITYTRFNESPGGNPDRVAAEHYQNWPGGRSNHYMFDMNRDWFALTQKETQNKVKQYLKWFPQVTVDLHEMGSEATFFAAAPAPPANPLLPGGMLEQYLNFGKAIGRTFDSFGWRYFHSEIFDSFYPGYGEAWPSLHGSVGMLFEQASAEGLAFKKRSGEILYHRDSVHHQSQASLSVIRHAFDHKEDLLKFFYNFRSEAILSGQESEYRGILMTPDADKARMYALGSLLAQQGIEVFRIKDSGKSFTGFSLPAQKNEKKDIPAGSLWVPFDQPASRLAQTLLLPELPMDQDFIQTQEKRFSKRYRGSIYDVTGWSLPIAYRVSSMLLKQTPKFELEAFRIQVGDKNEANPSLGFLIQRNDAAMPFVTWLLKESYNPFICFKSLTVGQRSLAPGAFFVSCQELESARVNALKTRASELNVELIPVESGWLDGGVGLGSGSMMSMLQHKVAMLWDRPVSSLSAGWMRYTMEQTFQYPVTLIKKEHLSSTNLNPYRVLIIPDGWYGSDQELAEIKPWVQNGGVLITISGGTDWALSEAAGLLSSAKEMAGGKLTQQDLAEHPSEPEDHPDDMVKPRQESPRGVPGVLVRAALDDEHWMSYGVGSEVAVMVDSDRSLRPIRLNRGQTVGRYSSENLKMSGYMPESMKEQLAGKAFLMVQRQGRGLVVAFAEDPNFRGWLRGLNGLVFNAIFLSPSANFAR